MYAADPPVPPAARPTLEQVQERAFELLKMPRRPPAPDRKILIQMTYQALFDDDSPVSEFLQFLYRRSEALAADGRAAEAEEVQNFASAIVLTYDRLSRSG